MTSLPAHLYSFLHAPVPFLVGIARIPERSEDDAEGDCWEDQVNLLNLEDVKRPTIHVSFKFTQRLLSMASLCLIYPSNPPWSPT